MRYSLATRAAPASPPTVELELPRRRYSCQSCSSNAANAGANARRTHFSCATRSVSPHRHHHHPSSSSSRASSVASSSRRCHPWARPSSSRVVDRQGSSILVPRSSILVRRRRDRLTPDDPSLGVDTQHSPQRTDQKTKKCPETTAVDGAWSSGWRPS